MKKNFKNLLFLISILIIVIIIHIVFKVKNCYLLHYNYNKNFDYDAIFVGTCKAYETISPSYLYKKYGIKSYCFGSSSQNIIETYICIKSLAEVNRPKFFIVDYHYFCNDDVSIREVPYSYELINSLPFSSLKIKLIIKYALHLPHFIDYIFYTHQNYSDFYNININKKFISYYGDNLNNYEGRYIEDIPKVINKKLEIYYGNGHNKDLLYDIINYCDEKNIKLILYNIPEYTNVIGNFNDFEKELINYCNDFNIPILNCDLNMFNIYTDFIDERHLNVSGAYKFTDFIGKYLYDNYTDIFIDNNDEYYNKLGIDYKNYKIELIRKFTKFKYILPWFSNIDEKMVFAFCINKDSKVSKDRQSIELIKNLYRDYDFPLLEIYYQENSHVSNYYCTIDRISGNVYESLDVEDIKNNNIQFSYLIDDSDKNCKDLRFCYKYDNDDDYYIFNFNYDESTGDINRVPE